MAERVVPLEMEYTWDPNAPDAAMFTNDMGQTSLALEPYPEDHDSACVVLTWSGTIFAAMASPDHDSISGHPLYKRGLKDVLWMGTVQNSTLIEVLLQMNRVRGRRHITTLTHYILPLKEKTVEVVAESLNIERRSGTTTEAVLPR